jgi:Protein of unknown function (DUF2442)
MAKQSITNGKTTAKSTASTPTLLHNVQGISCADVGIVSATFFADGFGIHLTDGRMITIPYWWFPRIAEASQKQREAYTLDGDKSTIWWEEIDEGLHVDGILAGKADNTNFAWQWRKQRGYAWFDKWMFDRLSEEQKEMLRERDAKWAAQKKVAQEKAEQPVTSLKHLRPTEVLYELSKREIPLSKQRLYQLTHGEKQIRNGKEYHVAPRLKAEIDYITVNGKVRYTDYGLQHLVNEYGKKRKSMIVSK